MNAKYLSLIHNFERFPKNENRCIKLAKNFLDIPQEQWCFFWLGDAGTYSATAAIENNEPLVNIQKICAERNIPIVFASGSTEYGGVGGEILLREGTLKNLLHAEEKVRTETKGEYTFMITDAYRPLALQRSHWDKIKAEFSHKEGLRGEALYDRVAPLIADPDLQPPHSTGGAVDLTLYNLKTSTEVFMGTKVDVFDTDLTWTWHSDIVDPEVRKNRALLYWAMTDSGFINQPQEWWHYSYGEREWACRTGINQAIYKPL